MSFQLETSRLILRDYHLDDTHQYFQQCQDPKYQRFYPEKDYSEETCSYLVSLFTEQASEQPRKSYHLAIIDKVTNEYLGIAGLRLEDEKQASVGCGLKRDVQASGLAEEAMSALVSYGFNTLGVHRVYAETISDNKAAIRLCRKVGMRREAEFLENRYFKGRWWSTTVMALLSSEFNAAKHSTPRKAL
ncbi:GNAT family N-acetyltransferase [Vibrio sonorensis]|uniref:GNAT family N-acetyltransferase n=1 Tax=Vibrio sonorensis TaxID=1004316 RepID=UPI0008DAC7DD|nr:GNAT family protein [Vibrio sonorensis]